MFLFSYCPKQNWPVHENLVLITLSINKAQISQYICADSPDPSLLVYTKAKKFLLVDLRGKKIRFRVEGQKEKPVD